MNTKITKEFNSYIEKFCIENRIDDLNVKAKFNINKTSMNFITTFNKTV